jgi:hypothetical protein
MSIYILRLFPTSHEARQEDADKPPNTRRNFPMSKEEKKSTTLREDEIVTQPDVGRRSMLAIAGATVLGAASKALGGCVVQQPAAQPAQTVVSGGGGTVVVHSQRSGITDNDSGQWADPVGNGRGGYRGVYTGITDGDTGTYSDPVNQGRGHWGRGGATGLTDGDTGNWADPVGGGRGHR